MTATRNETIDRLIHIGDGIHAYASGDLSFRAVHCTHTQSSPMSSR